MKNKLNIAFSVSFGLAIILTFWIYKTMTKNVGDITFDIGKDNPEFKICDEKRIFQYYSVGTQFRGSRNGMRKELMNLVDKTKVNFRRKSGYITYRFIVNCKGESGWFRYKMVDSDLKKTNFDIDTVDYLELAIKKLQNWEPGTWNNTKVDSYCQINFKILNGVIIDVF